MVERCVRDAEAACSNHVASIHLFMKSEKLVQTGFFSYISKAAGIAQSVEQRIRNAWVEGSSPFSSFDKKTESIT